MKVFLVLLGCLCACVGAWTSSLPRLAHQVSTRQWMNADKDYRVELAQEAATTTTTTTTSSRRQLLTRGLSVVTCAVMGVGINSLSPAYAVTRAVGVGEEECRKAGNCLEIGEWDGAVGWSWGGKDRCDPSDPLCGPDGKLRDEPLQGQPIPQIDEAISHVAAIEISIGREETSVLRLGLYGDAYPEYVSQLLDFFSPSGLTTANNNANSLATSQAPVSLVERGAAGVGSVTNLLPSMAVVLGIPSQASAYAKAVGSTKVLDGFVPQPAPAPLKPPTDKNFIPHNRAGLLSVPLQGLGYGGLGFESNDEIFGDAFWITDAALPENLSKRRLVVGQVLDASSMAFLERLANLPTQRGIRGVLPGQNSGPPLKKVTVRQVEVATVVNRPQ